MAKVLKAETTTSTTTPEKGKKAFKDRIGISSDTLKTKLNREAPFTGKLKSLHDTLSSRIKDGRRRALADYKAWAAVDLAFQAPFFQVTPTIMGNILQTKVTPEAIRDELASWGLSEKSLFSEVTVNGEKLLRLNEQTFYKILLPTVITYSEAREAKLYNDRDQFPLLKYEPVNSTVENSLVSEAITNLFEKQGHQMGDRATLKRVIKHGIKYGTVLAFPMESWYSEKSTDEKGDEYCVAEGLRYQVPHPTRMFYDLSHPPSSFNTDTGCDFAGHWRVMRWGDIENSSIYWNTKKVEYGRVDWKKDFNHYFSSVYPCTMDFPRFNETKDTSREGINNFYNTSDHDKGVLVTDFFWKLIPSDWGLGDYKYPCWFRFVVASDDTVIFAEPIPYTPPIYLGLDVDENQARNASFSLKIIPFGDHMGNILSQIILSMKQNATKIVVYDEKQVSEENIRSLRSENSDVSKIKFLAWDSTKSRNAQLDPGKMLFPLGLPQQPVAEQTNTLNVFISVMERMLGISPQEVGAAGVHVQTAEESRILASSTSQRVDYTGTHVDDFLDAWKKQKYFAAMAFMDEEFTVEVSGNEKYKEVLAALGFELRGETERGQKKGYVIKGEKSKLRMEAFVSVREGKNRINNPQIAQVLLQTIQAVAGNQMLSDKVGAGQIISWLNRATQLAGGPNDAQLVIEPTQDQAAQIQQLQQELQQVTQLLQQTQEQSQSDTIKAQTELQKAQIGAETALAAQQMKNQGSATVAQIGAAAKIQVAQQQAEDNLILSAQQKAVEAQNKEADRKQEAALRIIESATQTA